MISYACRSEAATLSTVGLPIRAPFNSRHPGVTSLQQIKKVENHLWVSKVVEYGHGKQANRAF